jgi:hypothetical protein
VILIPRSWCLIRWARNHQASTDLWITAKRRSANVDKGQERRARATAALFGEPPS